MGKCKRCCASNRKQVYGATFGVISGNGTAKGKPKAVVVFLGVYVCVAACM